MVALLCLLKSLLDQKRLFIELKERISGSSDERSSLDPAFAFKPILPKFPNVYLLMPPWLKDILLPPFIELFDLNLCYAPSSLESIDPEFRCQCPLELPGLFGP